MQFLPRSELQLQNRACDIAEVSNMLENCSERDKNCIKLRDKNRSCSISPTLVRQYSFKTHLGEARRVQSIKTDIGKSFDKSAINIDNLNLNVIDFIDQSIEIDTTIAALLRYRFYRFH